MSNLFRGPSKDASYQISIHLAKRLQRRRFFRNQPIRNKNCLWQPCLLTDRDEMSNLYRGHSKDASYQVSIHLAMRLQRISFFLISQSKTRIAYGSHVCYRDRDELAIFIEDLPRMLPTKFQFIWPSGYRGEDSLEINQSEMRIAYGSHVCYQIGTK